MKKSILLFLFMSVYCLSSYSQFVKKVVGYNTGNYTLGANMMSVVDSSGALYQLWSYNGTFIAGNDTIDFIGGNNDYALAKYDVAGNLLWTTSFGNTNNNDAAWSLTMNGDNNLLFGTINNGPLYFQDTIVNPSAGWVSSYIIELDTAGHFISKKEFANFGAFNITGDNTYYFESASSPLWIPKINKIDATGSISTFIQYTNILNGGVGVRKIQTAPNGDLLIYGTFIGSFTLGTFTLSDFASGFDNAYVCRIDTSGNVKWAERFETPSAQFTCDNFGNTYAYIETGHCSGLPTYHFGNYIYNNCPGEGSMVIKLDNTGQVVWQQRYYSMGGSVMESKDIKINNQQQLLIFGGKGYNSGVYPVAPYIAGVEGTFVMKLDGNTGDMIWITPVGKAGPFGGINTSDFETYFLTSYFSEAAPYQCAIPNLSVFWSGMVTLKDTVPPTPTINFNTLQNANTFYFENHSTNVQSFSWDFGDGSAPEIVKVNPTHSYALPGVYNVCVSANNSCGASQKCKSVGLSGIKEVIPKKIAQTGTHLFNIRGYFPLYDGGLVKFIRSGATDLIADTVNAPDSSLISIRVTFINAQIGNWDLVVETSTGTYDTLLNALYLDTIKSFDPWVEVTGQSRSLINKWYHYQVRFGNNGNTTEYGLPIVITATGNRDMILATNLIIGDSINQDIIDSIPDVHMVVDSVSNDSINYIFLLVPIIIPQLQYSIDIFVKSSNISSFEIASSLYPSVYDSIQLSGMGIVARSMTSCKFLPTCFQCMLDLVSYVPIVNCLTTTADMGCSLGNLSNCYISNGFRNIYNLEISAANYFGIPNYYYTADEICTNEIKGPIQHDIIKNLAKSVLNCSGLSLSVNAIKSAILKAGILKYSGGAVVHLFDQGIGSPNWFNLSCGKCFDKPKEGLKKCYSVGSLDPNVKEGPVGYTSSRFIDSKSPIGYGIYFENVDTATSPVSEVTLIDQLDTSKLDLSTFSFTGFGWADSIYSFYEVSDTIVKDFDLRPLKNCILRIQGTLDRIHATVNWKFSSLDTITFNIVADPFNGFLPPNIIDREGKGFVSYSVNTKSTVNNLDTISNFASIIFDYNAPIITPVWINTIDIGLPQSQINPILANSTDTLIQLTLNSNDAESGVFKYNLFVSVNDSAFAFLGAFYNDTILVDGEIGSKYEFYSIAIDSAGNIEDAPNDPDNFPDATTTITVGFNEINSSTAMQVLPNPANDMVSVTILSSTSQDYTIEIVDVQGRTMFMRQVDKNQQNQSLQISTSNFNNGLYYIKARSKEFNHVQKLTVLH